MTVKHPAPTDSCALLVSPSPVGLSHEADGVCYLLFLPYLLSAFPNPASHMKVVDCRRVRVRVKTRTRVRNRIRVSSELSER